MTPTVIGLDISIRATGVASSRGWCEIVGQAGLTKLDLPARIATVDRLAGRIVDLVGAPDLVVVEAVSMGGSRLVGVLERDALWWLVVRRLARFRPVAEVAPSTLKRYATGKGNAMKQAVVDAVARRYPQYETGGDDNMCDAVVLAAMGADWLGDPLVTVPTAQRGALDKVAWPQTVVAA